MVSSGIQVAMILSFLVNPFHKCSMDDDGGLQRLKSCTEGSNLSSSASKSKLQRISARFAPKYANNARISRLFPGKPDFREQTARRQSGDRPAFSPEGICAVRFQ